jgi:hypothetical protein
MLAIGDIMQLVPQNYWTVVLVVFNDDYIVITNYLDSRRDLST